VHSIIFTHTHTQTHTHTHAHTHTRTHTHTHTHTHDHSCVRDKNGFPTLQCMLKVALCVWWWRLTCEHLCICAVVITCPETMRVHMVRYNLHSTLQQYKFDGLVAALDSVEGGQELFFNSTLPHIIARALNLSEILRSSQGIIPTMRKDSRSKFVIPRYQVWCKCRVESWRDNAAFRHT
jgi:hypothetical protein